MIYGWDKQYHLRPIIEGDFDYYKITFPITKSGTITNTITKGEDKEKEILEIIENNPSMGIKQMSSIVNLTHEGVKYHIKNLKGKGRIKREGSKKSGRWQVNKG